MKPKWKPHDDPKCGCQGCAQHPAMTLEQVCTEIRKLGTIEPTRFWRNAPLPTNAIAARIAGLVNATCGDPGDEDSYRTFDAAFPADGDTLYFKADGIYCFDKTYGQHIKLTDGPRTKVGQMMALAELGGWSPYAGDPGDEN